MAHDAFISYSSRDKTTADAACAALEAAGIRCWIAPRDITPGAEWGEAIIDAIGQARVLVLVFSTYANESPQIRREVERAVHKGIPIVPLRIEDIAPTRSLEYFIGTVHWLDALTPPLEAHLRKLVEALRALLQIQPTRPSIVPSAVSPASRVLKTSRLPVAIVLGCLALIVAAGAVWRIMPRQQATQLPSPSSASTQIPTPTQSVSTQTQTPAEPNRANVDPVLVGTFEFDSVVDDYNWHFVYTIKPDAKYRLITTQEENGTYRAANGSYWTKGAATGRVRTGSYRAVGTAAIELNSSTGTATFRPEDPAVTIDQKHPIMLGLWRSTIQQGGLTWTLTIQNNPDGTFHFQGQAEDNGTCIFNDQNWRTMSVVTGQSNTGTYRVLDARIVEITGSNGPTLWRRQ
jgi:TIR domain-containing protein